MQGICHGNRASWALSSPAQIKGDLTGGIADGMLRPAPVFTGFAGSRLRESKCQGRRVEHMVGSGSVFVVDTNTVLTGTLGEGPARF